MTENFTRLVSLLRELFQMDRPDLDFGIYRIMNQKRKDVSAFLENDLLPQVRQELSKVNSGGNVQAELDAAIKQLHELGVDPESSVKVKSLREKLSSTVNAANLENEIYSHLYNFFRRYYKDGDFLSLRRYKKDVYAIPYEGEEVKLHWANADQYYIKSAENFRDYAFLAGEAPTEGQEDTRKRVHFKLVDADTEVANNKAKEGKERRFMLCDDTPMLEEDGELIIRFEYKPTAKKQNQKSLNETAVRTILDNAAFVGWVRLLAQEDNGRSCLEKHLNIYTARNTFDYFIHKDLGGFLRRELDFYIKNEVLFLDDIESQTAAHVEGQLTQIRILRRIAHKIIRFLEQIENFQKKLWLKKKFVVETNYLITLDRVPEELYPEIAANDAQREEWVRLFAIDEIKKNSMSPGYSVPLSIEFLKSNNNLVLDTRVFSAEFKKLLVFNFEHPDDNVDGLLLNSDNFHALNLLNSKYINSIKCIYIDPPYNTENDTFLYKDKYKSSSWLSMICNSSLLAEKLVKNDDGFFSMSIDKNQMFESKLMLNSLFTNLSFVNSIVNVNNPKGRSDQKHLPTAHDNILLYATDGAVSHGWEPQQKVLRRYRLQDTRGDYREIDLRKTGDNDLATDRPKMAYPFAYNEETRDLFPIVSGEKCPDGYFLIYPMKDSKTKGRWRWEVNTSLKNISRLIAKYQPQKKQWSVFEKDYLGDDERVFPTSVWDEKCFNSERGSEIFTDLGFNKENFPRPKPVGLLEYLFEHLNRDGQCTLDYFAGSGTTAHAIINQYRLDKILRKYILVEMGEHCESLILPRISKSVYSESWKDGEPTTRHTGVSHCCKYLRLESYEDTLNNLELTRSQDRLVMIATNSSLKEEYMLSYMINLETLGSASLLNMDRFADPWNYTMKISSGSVGETKVTPVDLVETFNYLLGLTVVRRKMIRGIEVIEGTNPDGESVLVIWRNTKTVSNEQLDEFFRKQEFNPRDTEFDLIYVNGDNNLENLKRADETWKVRLTEEEFKRLMFDVEDV